MGQNEMGNYDEPDFNHPLRDFDGQLEDDAQRFYRAVIEAVESGDRRAILAAIRREIWREVSGD